MKYLAIAAALAAAVPLFARQEAGGAAPQESRTAWLRRVYATDRCTFGDGARGVLGLVSDAHVDGPFDSVRKDLAEPGIVASDWTVQESDKLTKGHLAYMLCRALKIEGGVVMRLFGPSRRYSLRECDFVGLIAGGSVDEFVSGRELLDILQKAAVYKAEGSLKSLVKP